MALYSFASKDKYSFAPQTGTQLAFPGAVGPTVPGVPTAITATAGVLQAVLNWQAPASTGGAAIISYTVKYRPVGASTYSVFGTTANLTATVTGLTAGQAYQFIVAATNSAGTGSYSNAVTATPTAGASGPKRQLLAYGNSETAGFGLGPNFETLNYAYKTYTKTQDLYGAFVNKGHSGYTTSQLLQMMPDTLAAIDTTNYAGCDVLLLAGVNDGGQYGTVSAAVGNLQSMIQQFNNHAPGKVRVFVLTMTATKGYYGAGGPANGASDALEYSVGNFIYNLDASIRTNAVSWGAANFFDAARITVLQDATNTTNFQDGLHYTSAGTEVLSDAAAAFLHTGAQPTGAIPAAPTPPAGGGTGGTGGPTYVEDPSLTAVPWTNPALIAKDPARIEILAANADGSRARALVTDGSYNNLVSTVKAFGEVSTNWIGEVRLVIQNQDEQVLGFPSYHTAYWGELRVAGYKRGNGTVTFVREGDTAAVPADGAPFAYQIGDELVYKLYKDRVEFWLNGAYEATLDRTETANLLFGAALTVQGSVVAVQVRGYSFMDISN